MFVTEKVQGSDISLRNNFGSYEFFFDGLLNGSDSKRTVGHKSTSND